MTTLYQVARNICRERGRTTLLGPSSHGWVHGEGFCEPCLVEAMSRWDGVARLIAEAVKRADAAEHELRAIDQVIRQNAPRGCLSDTAETTLTTTMRVLHELRRP